MQGARNEIFAMQPAPIQVSYMGFPGTTGATYIDYLVTDEVCNWIRVFQISLEHLFSFQPYFSIYYDWLLSFTFQFVSPLQYAHIYSEKLVHLPHCYFVNDYKQVCSEKSYLYHVICTFSSVPRSYYKTHLYKCYLQKNQDVLDPNSKPKRSDYGLPEDKFIFACFNQLYKMDPEIVNTW